jgi:acyl-CoA synthetase (AMP-forming)/AMP-acid ligase II
LLAPAAFMRRPLAWLRAIGEHRAEVATAPDFAYDLCVRHCRPEAMTGIDLSCWRVALDGAEPVRAATLDRFAAAFAPWGFAAESLYPAYGLAEATLLVSGGRRGRGPVRRSLSRAGLRGGRVAPPEGGTDASIVVGCGRALDGERLAIVEPETRIRLQPAEIGEVWVAGPNVAAGYWRQEPAAEATFRARIAGEASGPWLRTGDLGFLDADGELFITGRHKDVVIIRGINHYPQDIEATVAACHPALAPHGGAAFAALDGEGRERLVVVHEVARSHRRAGATGDILAKIREALSLEHDLAAWRIVLLRPGGLPKTTSGKVQRSRARQLWLQGQLDAL